MQFPRILKSSFYCYLSRDFVHFFLQYLYPSAAHSELFLPSNPRLPLSVGVQGAKRSERLNLQFCRVTFNRRTSSTPHSSALQNCKFSSFCLFDLCHRNFPHFQGRRKRRTGRTPTEDNAENGQNHMAEAFGPLYAGAIIIPYKISR